GLLRRETEKHDVGSQIYSRLAEGRHQRAGESAVSRDAESAASRGADSARLLAVELSEPILRGTASRNEVPMGTVGGAEPAGHIGGESAGYRDAESAGYRDAESAVNRGGAEPDGRQRVMMLYRAGFSPSLIASRVGAPVGEVELII